MAAGTGILMGYFASIFISPFLSPIFLFAIILSCGVLAVLLNLWTIHGYFKGKLRGAFEYVYRESILDAAIESEISSARPVGADVGLELASLAIYRALMARAATLTEEMRFICYMAAARVANIGSEDRNAVEALKRALSFRPNDVIANFRLARSFERIGSANEAIDAYKAALHDPSIDSDELKAFIAAQGQRVREKGPDQRSLIPGLIYQLM